MTQKTRITKLRFNNRAFTQLRLSDGAREDLARRGEAVAIHAEALAQTPSGMEPARFVFEVGPTKRQTRLRAGIWTANLAAMHAEGADGVLLRALDAGK